MKRIMVFALLLLALTYSCTAFAQEDVELEMWVHTLESHKLAFEKVAELFTEKNPHITIEVVSQPNISEKIKTAVSADEVPDMIGMEGHTIYDLMVMGELISLDPVLSLEEVIKTQTPEYWTQATLDGEVYALGFADPPNTAGAVVNKKLLREAGLDDEIERFKSREHMLEYAKKLTDIDQSGTVMKGGLNLREYNNKILIWDYIIEKGGQVFDNEKGEFRIDNEISQEVHQWYYDLMHEHRVDDPMLPEAFDALSQEISAMAFIWPEYIVFSRLAYPDMDMGLILKPPFEEGNRPVVSHRDTWNLALMKRTEHEEEALKFAEFVAQPEIQMEISKINPGHNPMLENLDHNEFTEGNASFLEPVIPSLKTTFSYGPYGGVKSVHDVAWDYIEDILYKEVELEEGLTSMNKEVNVAVSSFYNAYPGAPDPTVFQHPPHPDDPLTQKVLGDAAEHIREYPYFEEIDEYISEIGLLD